MRIILQLPLKGLPLPSSWHFSPPRVLDNILKSNVIRCRISNQTQSLPRLQLTFGDALKSSICEIKLIWKCFQTNFIQIYFREQVSSKRVHSEFKATQATGAFRKKKSRECPWVFFKTVFAWKCPRAYLKFETKIKLTRILAHSSWLKIAARCRAVRPCSPPCWESITLRCFIISCSTLILFNSVARWKDERFLSLRIFVCTGLAKLNLFIWFINQFHDLHFQKKTDNVKGLVFNSHVKRRVTVIVLNVQIWLKSKLRLEWPIVTKKCIFTSAVSVNVLQNVHSVSSRCLMGYSFTFPRLCVQTRVIELTQTGKIIKIAVFGCLILIDWLIWKNTEVKWLEARFNLTINHLTSKLKTLTKYSYFVFHILCGTLCFIQFVECPKLTATSDII